jgi:hypothetical protein
MRPRATNLRFMIENDGERKYDSISEIIIFE